MLLFGCPIGFRHIHKIAADQIFRVYHRLFPRPKAQIHLVYFSCARDMPLISISLKSLARLDQAILGNIYIVVDSKGPFSAEEKLALSEICPKVRFLDLGRIDWASLDTLITELKAFGIAAEAAGKNDFVAKIDSDVFFLSDEKLREISVCASDFVGDGHYSSYSYAQGGLYFLRKDLALQLAQSVNLSELASAIEACGTQAEDQVISLLARQRTNNIWLTRIMLFPDEFSIADLSAGWVRQEFSALHFVRQKAEMASYFQRIESS